MRPVRSIIDSLNLSSSDLKVVAGLMGVILILAIFQHLFFGPSNDLENQEGIILRREGKIDINSASYHTLQELPGVGSVLAGRIITYRRAQGGFQSIQEIKNVKGIGPKTFEKLKDKITVGKG